MVGDPARKLFCLVGGWEGWVTRCLLVETGVGTEIGDGVTRPRLGLPFGPIRGMRRRLNELAPERRTWSPYISSAHATPSPPPPLRCYSPRLHHRQQAGFELTGLRERTDDIVSKVVAHHAGSGRDLVGRRGLRAGLGPLGGRRGRHFREGPKNTEFVSI